MTFMAIKYFIEGGEVETTTIDDENKNEGGFVITGLVQGTAANRLFVTKQHGDTFHYKRVGPKEVSDICMWTDVVGYDVEVKRFETSAELNSALAITTEEVFSGSHWGDRVFVPPKIKVPMHPTFGHICQAAFYKGGRPMGISTGIRTEDYFDPGYAPYENINEAITNGDITRIHVKVHCWADSIEELKSKQMELNADVDTNFVKRLVEFH